MANSPRLFLGSFAPALPRPARRATPPAARRERRRSAPESRPPRARRWPLPALPIASVATGTPFGICTIESSESRPFSGVAAMGTASTGSSVLAAITPARCAAPPAPAIITRMPRARAASTYSKSSIGGAMRAQHARLVGNLQRAQNFHGRREHFVVALAAHHHAHQRLFAHGVIIRRRKRAATESAHRHAF